MSVEGFSAATQPVCFCSYAYHDFTHFFEYTVVEIDSYLNGSFNGGCKNSFILSNYFYLSSHVEWMSNMQQQRR